LAVRLVTLLCNSLWIGIFLLVEFVEDGLVELTTQNRQCTFQIRAVPLPEPVTRLLDDNASLLAVIEHAQSRRDEKREVVQLNDQTLEQIRQLEYVFIKITHYPDLSLRQQLTHVTQLPDKKIQVSFVNFCSSLFAFTNRFVDLVSKSTS